VDCTNRTREKTHANLIWDESEECMRLDLILLGAICKGGFIRERFAFGKRFLVCFLDLRVCCLIVKQWATN
jgi:hypothetical protein